jgi:hypothetical protein
MCSSWLNKNNTIRKGELFMLLNIYIGSVVITILAFAGAMYGINKELKMNFTKEELKSFKKKKGSTSNPFTTVVAIFCPIVNVLYALVFIFAYNSVRDKLIVEYKRILRVSELDKAIDKLRAYK